MSYYTSNSNLNSELIEQAIQNVQSSCQKLSNKEVMREVQEELSKLVVLLQRVEKLILRNSSGNNWLEKFKRAFKADRRVINQRELSILVCFLEMAIESLVQTTPNIHFAESIRIEIERVVCRYEHPISGFIINRFMDAQRSPSTPIKVVFGLITALGIYGGSTFVIMSLLFLGLNSSSIWSTTTKQIAETNRQIASINEMMMNSSESQPLQASQVGRLIDRKFVEYRSHINFLENRLSKLQEQEDSEKRKFEDGTRLFRQLVWVILAGTLGSIISILIRIEEFQGKKYLDPLVPFLVGAFKPIIGASFGVLFFTIISSELITIKSIPNEVNNNTREREALLFAIAFIVGFSERLARDTIGRAEEMMGVSQTAVQSKQTNLLLENLTNGSKLQQSTKEDVLQTQQKMVPNISDDSLEATKKN